MSEYISLVKYKIGVTEIRIEEAARNSEQHDLIYWKGYRDALKSILKVMES